MINIVLTGCNGRMGKAIIENIKSDEQYREQYRIIAGIDINQTDNQTYYNFPVLYKISDYINSSDNTIIIDFSNHTSVYSILKYALPEKLPVVIATTGHTDDEKALMKQAALSIPIFSSGNMSLGINLLSALVKKAAAILGGNFDIEIVEKHHNQKLDAPSGTAIMLANSASEAVKYEPNYKFERHSVRKARDKNEIGIHSVRGGTIVGDHEVIFAGNNEIISLGHSASSRDIFVHGALRAASFIINKPAGLYNMTDIVNEVEL
jgi:4-hydroxy-tetrahydrodipicolinate reductase